MNTLESLQKLANKSVTVDKTRLTSCIVGKGSLKHREQRLWVWFVKADSPYLMKKHWLSGDDKRDLSRMMNDYLTNGTGHGKIIKENC
jgi:hypothetical protein